MIDNFICGGLREEGVFKSSKKGLPLISIITVVFNGSTTIQSTIDSVINQSYKNIEYIICDGGSTDGTIDILKKNTKTIDHWTSQTDDGLYDAMNKGIDLANGDWLMFLGSDDYLFSPHSISELVELSLLHPLASLVFGNVEMSNGKVFINSLTWKIFLENTVHHQGVIYHRSLFNFFRYDRELMICSDYELNLICYLRKERVVSTNTIVSHFSLAGASSKSNSGRPRQEVQKIRRKHLGFVVDFALIMFPRLIRLIGLRYKSQFMELIRDN
jgi:putative colanic acid biosynthesis glycosyltransferase